MANLEREAINLAHIWPKTYSSLEDGKEKICCYWFIGLKLDKEGGKGGYLDLTTPCEAFKEKVRLSAVKDNMWKTGMEMEACYKGRKDLKEYLPNSEKWKVDGGAE